MSDNNELLQKVVDTTNVGSGGGGLLNADQSDRFLDYMWDATVLGSQVRKIRMKSSVQDIDKIAVGTRIARLATESTDDGVNAGATFSKVSLTTKKIRLDFELSTESLEDNIEGEALEDHIARLMATQFGNDLEDLAINGDTTLTTDPLLKSFDGYRKLLLAGAHVVDFGGSTINRGAFNKALKVMPRKYLQRKKDLKFFSGSNIIQDYLFTLQQVESGFVKPYNLAEQGINQAVKPEGPAGYTTGYAFGTTVQEVPFMTEQHVGDYSGAIGDHGDLWLTFPNNLVWGIKREVSVYREFRPKKDSIEYTVYTRTGVQVENLDAVALVKNVKIAT